MKTTTENTDTKRRYHMVENNGFVRGEIMLHPEQVKQFRISLGCKLMRHLPATKSYDIATQGVIV